MLIIPVFQKEKEKKEQKMKSQIACYIFIIITYYGTT